MRALNKSWIKGNNYNNIVWGTIFFFPLHSTLLTWKEEKVKAALCGNTTFQFLFSLAFSAVLALKTIKIIEILWFHNNQH